MRKVVLHIIIYFTAVSLHAQTLKAVLVQLNSEHNKIIYFRNHGNIEEANRVQKESRRIMSVTIKDFSDHFSFCPVYYFVDTSLSLIKAKKFDGILLDSNYRVSRNICINASDSLYLIAYYGYPAENGVSPNDRKGIVILDDKLEEVFYNLRPSDESPIYSYISSKYDMVYRPFARPLNIKLKRRYGE